MPFRFPMALAACAALAIPLAAQADEPLTRRFDLGWTIEVKDIPAGAREAVVWIAVPQERPEQQVRNLKVNSDAAWKAVEDPTFHNKVVRIAVPHPASSLAFDLSASVTRLAVQGPRPAVLSATERALYTRQEALVSLSPRVHALADSIGGTSRSRYDYVRSTMDYDKVTPGWGRGDTERACDVRKGNCTDYHSLFMSLSRAEGVPAIFEMGYPTLAEGETAHAGGYHCWAWFYDDDGKAWLPVDISEADKHPEKAEYFYGHLDADRILFSRGRDVKLPGMKGEPLNYLPAGAYVEVDRKPLEAGVTRLITYKVLGAETAGRSVPQ